MKTPLQELISIIRKRQEDDDVQPFMWHKQIIELAESLLEKEKEFIEDVYVDGLEDEYQFHTNGKKQIQSYYYYNKKFNAKNK